MTKDSYYKIIISLQGAKTTAEELDIILKKIRQINKTAKNIRNAATNAAKENGASENKAKTIGKQTADKWLQNEVAKKIKDEEKKEHKNTAAEATDEAAKKDYDTAAAFAGQFAQTLQKELDGRQKLAAFEKETADLQRKNEETAAKINADIMDGKNKLGTLDTDTGTTDTAEKTAAIRQKNEDAAKAADRRKEKTDEEKKERAEWQKRVDGAAKASIPEIVRMGGTLAGGVNTGALNYERRSAEALEAIREGIKQLEKTTAQNKPKATYSTYG